MTVLVGIIFVIAGVMSAIIMTEAGIQSGEFMFMFVGCLMGLVFVAVGVYQIFKQAIEANLTNKILREGKTLTGKIVDYKDGDGVVVNGVPQLNLVVETTYAGELTHFIVPTNQYSEKGFPIGAYVDFALLGVETALIKGTVRFNDVN